MEKIKKQRGDRRDAVRVRGLDAMHVFMPYLLPNRTDNEAFINEKIDLTEINRFLEKKNKDNPDYKYTIFHVFLAALARTICERPKMNRFIAGHRLYQRRDISFSFVAKRVFSDDGDEALLITKCDRNTTVDTLHDEICRRVSKSRKEGEVDDATATMDILTNLPRFLLRFVIRVLNFLEYHDLLPRALCELDPYHATVFISNLGSIKLNAAYHHLTNWGTNSIFIVIGEKHREVTVSEDGTENIREILPFGITLDERIADGYYYAKTIRVLKNYLENPELLEKAPAEADDPSAIKEKVGATA